MMLIKVVARKSPNGVLDYPADVVINAANSRLSHGGGLAKALATRIPGLQSASNQLVQLGGDLAPGEYRFQMVRDAPWKAVCHMVAPRDANDISVIKSMLVSGLTAVAGKGYKSVALPLLGVGVFGLPMDKVCSVYYEAFMEILHLDLKVFVITREAKEQMAMEQSQFFRDVCAVCKM